MEIPTVTSFLERASSTTTPTTTSTVTSLLDDVRAWRGACVNSKDVQDELIAAGVASALMLFLRACELGSGGETEVLKSMALARRVGWQALGNLCAGNEIAAASVFEAIMATDGTEDTVSALSVLEIGLVAATSDSALASVIAGVTYTSARGAHTRLTMLVKHERIFLSLLRLAQPAHVTTTTAMATTTTTTVKDDDDDGPGEWIGFLTETLFLEGIFPSALVVARRGLCATALFDDNEEKRLQQAPRGFGITTEVTVLVFALQAAVEASIYGSSSGSGSGDGSSAGATVIARSSLTVGQRLRECAPVLRQLFIEASAGALDQNLDTSPLLTHLHIALCLRTVGATLSLLTDDAACGGKNSLGDYGDGGVIGTTEIECEMIGTYISTLLIAAAVTTGSSSSSSSSSSDEKRLPEPLPPRFQSTLARALALLFADASVTGGAAFERGAINADGVAGLLAHTGFTERAPTLREWALLGVRRLAAARGDAGDAARKSISEAADSARNANEAMQNIGK